MIGDPSERINGKFRQVHMNQDFRKVRRYYGYNLFHVDARLGGSA